MAQKTSRSCAFPPTLCQTCIPHMVVRVGAAGFVKTSPLAMLTFIDGDVCHLGPSNARRPLPSGLRTGQRGRRSPSPPSPVGGPTTAWSLHRSIPRPHPRRPSADADPDRRRPPLRRLRQPAPLQEGRLHRRQTSQAALDHPAAGLLDLPQTVVGTGLAPARHRRPHAVPPCGPQALARRRECSQRPSPLPFEPSGPQRPAHAQTPPSRPPRRRLAPPRRHHKERGHQAPPGRHLVLALPCGPPLRLRQGGGVAPRDPQGPASACGLALPLGGVPAGAPCQGRRWAVGRGPDLEGAVGRRRALLAGLAVPPPGDPLWRLGLRRVDQVLAALQRRLDGRPVRVPPRPLPPRSGARRPLQGPPRPGPAGGVGGADRDRGPQPPRRRPRC